MRNVVEDRYDSRRENVTGCYCLLCGGKIPTIAVEQPFEDSVFFNPASEDPQDTVSYILKSWFTRAEAQLSAGLVR